LLCNIALGIPKQECHGGPQSLT